MVDDRPACHAYYPNSSRGPPRRSGWAGTYETARALNRHCIGGLRALVGLTLGSSASSSAVQSQMPAEEARTSDDQVRGYGKLRADPVPAAQPRDERADKEQRCSVHAESVNRTDPAFGA